jgi:hypothetical protein
MEPQRMRGYGALSEEDARAIQQIVAELNATLQRLIADWNKGPDADLQARFARLEKTTDEAGRLRELERVVTAHGLIEFRSALAMLLGWYESGPWPESHGYHQVRSVKAREDVGNDKR